MTMQAVLLCFLALSSYAVDAATKVAVLEFGKGGSVRRTTTGNVGTTVEGVTSFWDALHQHGRKLQRAGMTVVPDLFKKADAGVVIGVSGSGVDLKKMPALKKLVSHEAASSEAVGHMEVAGYRLNELLSSLDENENVDASSLVDSAKNHGKKLGLSGLSAVVDNASARVVDQQMSSILKGIKEVAEETGTNIVVHLVVEEDMSATHVSESRRRLEDQQQQEENNEENDNAEQGADDEENQRYFGYGYYNDFGEWVTPYKTMFQIQYFNVVLWTSIGLVSVLFFTIYLMMFMPLEPDTLLFGEAAKVPDQD